MNQSKKNIWYMGLTSFFTDVSSEMIFPVLPIFLTTVLKANMAVVGLIEGIAESTSSLLKLISGWLSDKFGKKNNEMNIKELKEHYKKRRKEIKN